MNNIVKENLDDIPENFKQYTEQYDMKKKSAEFSSIDSDKFILLMLLFLLYNCK